MTLPDLPSLQDQAGLTGGDPTFESSDPSYLVLPDPQPGLLRKAAKLASLSFGYLDKATNVTRFSVLGATGQMSFEGWKKYAADAWNGKARLSGRDMMNFYLDKDTIAALDQPGVSVPHWVGSFLAPERAALGSGPVRVTVGDLAATSIEMTADPFTILALTPPGAAAKITRMAKFPFTPLARFLEAHVGPGSWGPLAMVNFIRDPERVLTGPQRVIFEDFLAANDQATRRLHGIMTMAQDDELIGDFFRRNYRTESSAKIAAKLHGYGIRNGKLTPKGSVELDPLEQKVFDRLVGIMDSQGLNELRTQGILPSSPQLDLFGPKAPLDEWLPKLVGKHHIPTDIWQSWSQENLGKAHLRLRSESSGAFGKKLTSRGERLLEPDLMDLDALDTFKDIMTATTRKLDLEPGLLKHSPWENTSDAIKSASPFQRRYVTDLINRVQGNARGRKQIQLDLLIQDTFEGIRQSPAGQRVIRLFDKLNGSRVSMDGLPDFSPTNKAAGLISHNIIRMALGGRLATGIQNLTQVTNYSVSRGIPATFKGLLQMSDRKYAEYRRAQNLLGDFQRLTSDNLWGKTLGDKFDNIIFAPVHITERIIRGVGFNIGVDRALKKRGIQSLHTVTDGKVAADIMREAHLESLTGAFLYGTFGKSPLTANPLIHVGTVLQSFPMKQAEFLADTFKQDGSAFLRFIGLHGFLIEQANKQYGVSGEDFLGFGFKPMTTSFGGVDLILSPPVKALLSTSQAFGAFASGDTRTAEKKFRESALGMDGVLGHVARASQFGLLPLPMLAVKQTQDLVQRIRTHRQEFPDGTFVDISTDDAIRDYLAARTSVQKARTELARDVAQARQRVSWTLEKRAKSFFDAMGSDSGDDFGHRAYDLVSGIEIGGAVFYPTSEMIDGALNRYIAKRTISRDLKAVMSEGFHQQVYLGAQMELMENISRGLTPIHTPSGRGLGGS